MICSLNDEILEKYADVLTAQTLEVKEKYEKAAEEAGLDEEDEEEDEIFEECSHIELLDESTSINGDEPKSF
jgi:hypothetical protein